MLSRIECVELQVLMHVPVTLFSTTVILIRLVKAMMYRNYRV